MQRANNWTPIFKHPVVAVLVAASLPAFMLAAESNPPSVGEAPYLSVMPLGLNTYIVPSQSETAPGTPSARSQAQVTLTPSDLSAVRVYPNPWRSDKHAGLPITFDQLAANSTVKIFTVSGHWVKTLPISNSSITWDLTNDSGAKVASGLYIYLVTADQGQKTRGQLAIIN